ncbi:MAG: hypothetical protein HC884_19910 [Chloroflexaceae bacterium]|nr:hypothetical protein [Chloroflexaceae bacterium]
MKHQNPQSIEAPDHALWATVQLGGSGFRGSPPASAMFAFADGRSHQAALSRLLDQVPLVQPSGMMGYTVEVNGMPGSVTVQTEDAQDTTEALVVYAAIPADEPFSGVGGTTLQYAWGGDNGSQAVGPARLDLALPEPLPADMDVQVRAALMEKNPQEGSDQRLAILRAEAGGATVQTMIYESDTPQVNVRTITLSQVPAGTEQVTVLLQSPVTPRGASQWNNPQAGDSVFLLGATVWHSCEP